MERMTMNDEPVNQKPMSDLGAMIFDMATTMNRVMAASVTRQCVYRKCENQARPNDEFCSDKCFLRDELEAELRNEEDDMRAHDGEGDGEDDGA
jgi:hypothetical protein